MIIFEDNEKTLSREIPIPKKFQEKLQALRKLYEPYLKTTKGGKVLMQNTEEKVYNNKGDKTKNGKPKNVHTIPVSVAKERLNMQNDVTPGSLEDVLFGGEEMKQLLKKGIRSARAKNTVPEVPQIPKLTKLSTSDLSVDSKDNSIELNGGTISISNVTENKRTLYVSQNQITRLSKLID